MKARGSRAEVMHGTARRTSGGLRKQHLKYNKRGKIVSKRASARAKKENRLVKAGYKTKKGTFGSFKKGKRVSGRRSRRRSRRKQRGGEMTKRQVREDFQKYKDAVHRQKEARIKGLLEKYRDDPEFRKRNMADPAKHNDYLNEENYTKFLNAWLQRAMKKWEVWYWAQHSDVPKKWREAPYDDAAALRSLEKNSHKDCIKRCQKAAKPNVHNDGWVPESGQVFEGRLTWAEMEDRHR